MAWIIVESRWTEARGRIMNQWDSLSEDDMQAILYDRNALTGKLQQNLNMTPDEADREVSSFEAKNRDLFEETAEQIKPYVGIAKQ